MPELFLNSQISRRVLVKTTNDSQRFWRFYHIIFTLLTIRILRMTLPFVTLYRLGSNKPGRKSQEHQEHSKGISFRTCLEFTAVEPPGPKDWQSHILFLRGHPSAQWLRLIGSKYHVDPEFFARHMDFRSASDKSNNFSIPSLPSSSWHLIGLP